MNWLTEDMSHNRRNIIDPATHPILFTLDGKRKLVKMRTFIKENKDNMAKIEEGYNVYKNEIEYYKKFLQSEGVNFTQFDT